MCKLMEYWLGANTHLIYLLLYMLRDLLILTFFLIFCSLSPAINALQDRLKENEMRVGFNSKYEV